jgi:DNA-directed RNA polymerase subunit alpha
MPDKVETIELSDTFGKFEVGPLEPGFGTTIGNTLRRVLLSSIQGAAIKYVRIEGLHHEFSAIPGTDSDYVDFILKLKELVLKIDDINEVELVLEHKGKGVITAAEIQTPGNVEILNPDLVLLNMNEDTDIRIELWAANGRGFTPSDKQDMTDKSIGVIPIDSIYSPIRKVNFFVSNQRVKEKMNFDKLTVEVESDGSINPKNALFLSAKILKDLYAGISQFEVEPEYIEEVQMDPELERYEKLFNMNVKELELTVRSANCLTAAKIEKIGELVGKSESEMLKYRNFGKKSLDEINGLLENYGLSLGMDVDSIFSQINEAKNRVKIKQ